VKFIPALRTAWQGLSPRERVGLQAAALVMGLFVAWSLVFRPAWLTVQSAAAERAQALATTERLQTLASQASALRAAVAAAAAQGDAGRPKPGVVDDTSRALVLAALGRNARLQAQGAAVVVSLEGISDEQLRQGLKTLRVRWGALPAQAELTPAADGFQGRIRLEWAAE